MQSSDDPKLASSTNDYYPFVVAEVSKLEQNTVESRRAAYARVREELLASLHQRAFRISQSEIAGECRACDAAIERVQAELAGT
jgi:hypothetical protein